jgi:CRP/FNR family transcriptional regulator, cyclic AMP receptor protein
MTVPKVFIASSSEGLVLPVGKLLERALSGTAEVSEWPREFQLTKAYIESLEDVLDTSDFAVVVFTPDDHTLSRKTDQPSPRDNVVFELGLFFGRLRRERCFVIKQRGYRLKVPTDLLGIELAQFAKSRGQDLESALDPACARIGTAIRDAIKTLPSRPRLNRAKHEAQASIRRVR